MHWVAETFGPGKLARDGWTRNIVKPGDEVTVTISPAKGWLTWRGFSEFSFCPTAGSWALTRHIRPNGK